MATLASIFNALSQIITTTAIETRAINLKFHLFMGVNYFIFSLFILEHVCLVQTSDSIDDFRFTENSSRKKNMQYLGNLIGFLSIYF